MTTYAYTAKAAIIARLAQESVPAGLLDGVQIAYAYPGTISSKCIYGGGVRFEHNDQVAESPGVMVAEETMVNIYIRVTMAPAGDVKDTDIQALAIGTVIAALFRSEPNMAGGHSVLGIARGQGDYTQTDDETISILGYQLRVQTNISYGSP